ncbi:MAG TPA: glycoside hydrolase family 38 C-terminal domain-containing protein, partial [Gemmatimonadales bacterium]|nr:glycoside hydrolase family 38 C-terminal domain-containing protein [Gemmatimonadales bacterium]
FRSPEVGGLGVDALGLGQGTRPAEDGVWVKGRAFGNELVEVRVGRSGRIDLLDRRTGQRYRDLLSVESCGDVGDTYSFAPLPGGRPTRNRRGVALRSLADGPLVSAVELRWHLKAGGERAGRDSVAVRLVVSLYAGSPILRFSIEIDNRARDHRLRARVPTGIRGGSAIAGSQFGMVERTRVGQAGRYPRETPVTTAPAHRYVVCAGQNRGLAILSPGFFEYELESGGDLLVTLLRAVGQLSRDDLSTRPGHAGWPVATPLAQCQGIDRIQLGLAPMAREQATTGTALARLWEDLFLPIQPVWLRQASPLSLPTTDIRLDGEGLVFSALKPAEQGSAMVLRCYNARPSPAAGAWHLSAPVVAAHRARADEQILHEIRLGEGGRSVPFHAAPHEIVTIMVSLAGTG